MSHQSGISATQDLIKAFAEACQYDESKSSQTRLIKIQLENDQFQLTDVQPAEGNWKEDFKKIQDSIKDNKPAYIIYQLDNFGDQDNWILICFVPESTHVRQKMLYASSKAALLKDLGQQKFQVKYYAYNQEECTLKVYSEYLEHQKASAPLTQQEQEAKLAYELEAADLVPSPQKRSHVSGMQVEFTEAAKAALQEFNDASLRMVILTVNLSKNHVDLEETIEDSYDFTNIHYASPFPNDQPRYVLVRVSNDTSNNDYNMFVYWCPGSSPVRQRMVYSSYRGSVLDFIQEEIQITLKGKFELDQKDELTLERLLEHLTPSETSPILNQQELGNQLNPLPPTEKPKFSRPPRPGRR